MTKRAPVLKYEFVAKNKDMFKSCQHIVNLFENIKESERNAKCSSCGGVNLRIKFKHEAGKYLVEERPQELLKSLPNNMIVAYGRKLFRVRDLL